VKTKKFTRSLILVGPETLGIYFIFNIHPENTYTYTQRRDT
jgi:hypothetical protein